MQYAGNKFSCILRGFKCRVELGYVSALVCLTEIGRFFQKDFSRIMNRMEKKLEQIKMYCQNKRRK